MVFNGNLFQFGNFIISASNYLSANSYKITPNQRQDLDSYRDADGILRRFALTHTSSKIEFEIQPMDNDKMDLFMQNIRNNYINYNERNANCIYFDPETGVNKTGMFYLSDTQFSINDCDSSSGHVSYGATKFTFVEY